MEREIMKIEVTLSEEEVNALMEQAIKDKMKLNEDMKLIESRSYSCTFIFSDEEQTDDL